MRTNHSILECLILGIMLTIPALTDAYAEDSIGPSSSITPDDPPTLKVTAGEYRALLDELAAERKHIDDLERRVNELKKSNVDLQQSQTVLQSVSSQTHKQVADIQKTINQQLGPFGFGDRINSFLGRHTFSLVGDAGSGFAYSRVAAKNNFTFEVDINPIIKLADWINFYGSVHAEVAVGGTTSLEPNLANLEIFPLGWKAPFEILVGLFDKPFGDWYETQYHNWINPFITTPLLYGAEAIVPASAVGLQARGGIQFAQLGQDADYTVWVDSGMSFESAPGVGAIPTPVIGEAANNLTGINLATNGKGFGGRFRIYPLPVELGLGRLELMATTYNAHWLNSLWYNTWGVGFVYRLGAFRTRGEWAQSYRSMLSLSKAAAYPGCCGHDNRQGWFVQFGYSLDGIPHPYLGEFLERRFDKGELLVRYSGVNQRAIVASDIVALATPDFNGSPAVFQPHAREVALGFDYWVAPSIVWKNEVGLELPRAGGQLYTFSGSSSLPTLSSIGNTENDVAAMTQFVVGF